MRILKGLCRLVKKKIVAGRMKIKDRKTTLSKFVKLLSEY